MRKIFIVAIYKLSSIQKTVIGTLSEHLVGDNHTVHHKICTGLIIGFMGVLLSKTGDGAWHVVCDWAGYGLHGVGMLPFVEPVAKAYAKRINKIDNKGGNSGD